MRRPQKDIQLTTYDDLLGISEIDDTGMDRVIEVPLAELFPFKNHPFHVLDDEKMDEIVESIRSYGVLNPALVRPRAEGGYELVAGHRRKRACELAGRDTMPVIVREYSDDESVVIMVDSNIQRDNILPSEKAFAYKMKLEALKHQGVKSETGSDAETADLVGKEAGDSGRKVQRYIRLTELLLPFCGWGCTRSSSRIFSSCHILLFVSCLGSILEHLFLCTLVKSGGSIYA